MAESLRRQHASEKPGQGALNQVGACGTTGGVSTLCAEEIRHAMSDAPANPMKAGLEDVVVSTSDICFIDGHKGRLLYRGFDVDDLVAQSTFEEVTYLLWYGKLPSRKELNA